METIEKRAMGFSKGRRYELTAYDGYIAGATEQKDIDIENACNIFCHTGCPHKTDPYDCLNNKCDTWKLFRRMMEE